MINYESDIYKSASLLIKGKRKEGFSWDEIRSLKFYKDFDPALWFNFLEMNIPGIVKELWEEIVDDVKAEEEGGIGVTIEICPASTIPSKNDFDYKLDESYGSAWMSYARRLQDKKFDLETIHSIKTASHKILNKLALDTRETGPFKGLVIGNVQSGKTANMAALMAMAADQGWNMFIILSGTIENLRIQTQERLIGDLKSATNISWVAIDNVKTSASFPQALSKLSLSPESKQRYLMVCLKNSTRLKNLLNWMKKDPKNRENLKILFIDDEADQAGVNSAKFTEGAESDPENIERTKINQCLVNLFMNRDGESKEVESKYRALDYVAYTATPYANILNEKPSQQSIYPANFVSCLPVSSTYIGPQTIFGIEGTDADGMNIVNIVSPEEAKRFSEPILETLPSELEKAVLWFYCCLAVQRVKRSTKPVSMLIHTSQRQADHEKVCRAIQNWFRGFSPIDFVVKCKEVYEEQIQMFSKNDFYASCPKYPLDKNIDDYLPFEMISKEIVSIFKNGLNHILIDSEGTLTYNKGVHLCVDNCAHNYIENKEHIRLLYPKESLDYAPGFIVIGGATLSRGLTIEGLVSTYFLRSVKLADTLMQMGRWFGYRIGYELLPRLWLTENTKRQFEFLSVLDFELRTEMKNMQDSGISPSQVGIRIKTHPKRSFLEISAKNKTKGAVSVSIDFTGIATQTTMFFEDEEKLRNNYDLALNFIGSLGESIDMRSHPKAKNYLEWEGVENDKALSFISSLKLPKSDTSFLDVDSFKEWYSKIASKNELKNWNVVVAGLDDPSTDKIIKSNGLSICKINRSKKITKYDDGIIRIGALRNPKDLFVDIDETKVCFDNEDKRTIDKSIAGNYKAVRQKAGLTNSSLLVIYFIDKDSQPRKNETNRTAMGTPVDVVGVSIVIPENERTRTGTYVSIKLDDNLLGEVDVDEN